MNLRQYLDFNGGYFRINREERNLSAIFYHILLLEENLKRFLKQIDCNFPIDNKETAIYFEYALLRDLWSNITKPDKDTENELKRQLILDFLKPFNRDYLEKISVYDFNKYFGAVRTLSSDYIASPSNWSIKYYNKNILDNDEFLKVCMFKWSFNAKPDIVIYTTNNTAICIEAKYESGEGKYPSNREERKIFKKRFAQGKNKDSYLVGQLSIQKKIMELLDINAQFIFLVQKKKYKTDNSILTLTWTEVFDNLNTKDCQYFITEWIDRIKKIE